MRILFLSLSLLNIVFLLWQFHLGRLDHFFKTKPQVIPEIIQTPSILLAEEAEKQQQQASAQLPVIALPAPSPVKTHDEIKDQPVQVIELAAENPAPAIAQCYEAGAFSDEAALQHWLKTQNLKREQLKLFYKGETAAPSSFLVYYRVGGSAEQIRQAKQFLQDKGISEMWVIPGGELQGAISLGVFSAKERAERVQAEMQKKGIAAAILPRQTGKPALYVQLTTDTAPKQLGKLWRPCGKPVQTAASLSKDLSGSENR